ETVKNIGDLNLPQGTKVLWKFNAQNTEQLLMAFSDSVYDANRQGENDFTVNRRFMKDESYTLKVSNTKVKHVDSISYNISVVADRYPAINIEEHKDSTNTSYLYFLGDANDDYGLKKLTFNYALTHDDSSGSNEEPLKTEDITIPKNVSASTFNYYWDMTKI